MSEMPVLPCKFEVELQTFKETRQKEKPHE